MAMASMLIHAHVPKTAGSAFNQRFIFRNHSEKEIFRAYRKPAKSREEGAWHRAEWDRFRKAKVVIGHVPYGFARGNITDARFVSVIREPIERTVSALNFSMLKSGVNLKQVIEDAESLENIDPDDLILRVSKDKTIRKFWENVMTRFLTGFTPQQCAGDAQCLGHAIANADASDNSILLNENFEADTRVFCDHFSYEWFEGAAAERIGKGENLKAESESDRPLKKFKRLFTSNDLGQQALAALSDMNGHDLRLYEHLSAKSAADRICK